MALSNRAILLICIFGYVHAQYPDGDVQPQKSPLLSKPRYQRLQNPRPISAQLASIPGTARARRPLPLSRPRPASIASNPSDSPGFPELRPRPVYISPLAIKSPTASTKEQLFKQEKQEQEQQQDRQQQSQIQQDLSVKPVNEEADEEEDVAQAIVNLGAVSSFSQQSGNLVAGPLTPKPDFGLGQFRSGPTAAPLARPAPIQVDQNVLPVQYRPEKPLKIRKPVAEQSTEARAPAKQQYHQHQHQHQQQHQQHQQQQQQQHHQQISQAPARHSAKISENKEKYSESRAKYSVDSRDKYPENHREKYSEPRANKQPKYAENRDDFSEKRDKYIREKKPVAQIIRRWREDNPDGSITWGFENDDGSFKEELIGVDCITRGKYGYIDLDGFRREYSYETGIKCDEEEQQEDQDNSFVDYQENKLVLANGKTIDLSSMGKKQARRPQPIYN